MTAEEPRRLQRDISRTIINQSKCDCFAHGISRPLLKIFRDLYPEHLGIDTPNDSCMALYENPYMFYDCDDQLLRLFSGSSCYLMNDTKLKMSCKNEKELLNLILYMFFWSTIVKEFGCNGGTIDSTISFILYKVIYRFPDISHRIIEIDGEKKAYFDFKNIMSHCVWKPDSLMFQKILAFFESVYIEKIIIYTNQKYLLPFPNSSNENGVIDRGFAFQDQDLFDPTRTEKFIGPQILVCFPGIYKNPNKLFFDKIKEAIDKNTYVTLSLLRHSLDIITEKSKMKKTKIKLNCDIFKRTIPDNSTEGHAVTIVDYNYDDPNDKCLIIKNTWGETVYTEGTKGSDVVYLYESELTLDCEKNKKYPSDTSIAIYNIYNLDEGIIKLISHIWDAYLRPEIAAVGPSDDHDKIFEIIKVEKELTSDDFMQRHKEIRLEATKSGDMPEEVRRRLKTQIEKIEEARPRVEEMIRKQLDQQREESEKLRLAREVELQRAREVELQRAREVELQRAREVELQRAREKDVENEEFIEAWPAIGGKRYKKSNKRRKTRRRRSRKK